MGKDASAISPKLGNPHLFILECYIILLEIKAKYLLTYKVDLNYTSNYGSASL